MSEQNHSTIEVIARAIITDGTEGEMLFCSPKSGAYYYLPGGHIEFGETAKTALTRELYEETGVDISEAEFHFAGAGENIFTQDSVPHHEVNLYFEVKGVFSGNEDIPSLEEEISFHWLPLSDIPSLPVLPEAIKHSLSEWDSHKELLFENEAKIL